MSADLPASTNDPIDPRQGDLLELLEELENQEERSHDVRCADQIGFGELVDELLLSAAIDTESRLRARVAGEFPD